MGAPAADPIDQHLRLLSRRLRGPARLKADLLLEARHGLEDAAASYRDAGLTDTEAARRAVADFGPVSAVAAAYQLELAASTTRRLSIRIIGIWLLLLLTADRMWQGAPWADAAPPTGYRLLSTSLSGAWAIAGLTAGSAYLYLTWAARRGRADETWTSRTFGRGLTGWLVLGASLGVALFAWSLALWEAARGWPPMILGMFAVGIAYIWLGRAARDCLLATAGPRGLTREPRRPLRPENARP